MGAEPSDRLMRCDEVETRITLSRSTIYRKMRKKSFPEPLRIGVRAVRWRESEVEAWLAALPRAEGDTPP